MKIVLHNYLQNEGSTTVAENTTFITLEAAFDSNEIECIYQCDEINEPQSQYWYVNGDKAQKCRWLLMRQADKIKRRNKL